MSEAIVIDGLIIDEETGEILDLPDGAGEPIAYLTARALAAKSASDEWERVYNIMRHSLGKLLKDAGLERLATEYGTPGWRSRKVDKAVLERLPEIVKAHELNAQQTALIFSCASTLNVGRLESLKMTGAMPPDAIEELIERGSTSWVQIDKPRPLPPRVETKAEAGKEGKA